jgi:MoaA/NifB/PqqE/SkfB family radical SAM enzyme
MGSSSSGSPTGIAPVLQVHPTRRCNIACAHCYSASGPTAREELPLELLSGCLDDAARLGYRQLAVSGGEPLLYRPLPDLLARARELGMVTTITSNGMLLTARRWEPLAALVDVLAISIDGTPEEHDVIRRCDGAFARTTANLEVVRSSGTPFGFIFTLTQHNADSLEFVVRLAAEEGARSVQVHPLTMVGRAAETMPSARPDEIELATALLEASLLGHELGVVIHVDALTADQLREHRCSLVPRRPVTDLAAVAPVLIVDADGTVIPLTHDVSPSLRLGTLTETCGLAALADEWLAAGRGDRLAEACERTWTELNGAIVPLAVYWYDVVAVQTRTLAPALRARPVAELVTTPA